jgi:hypothetical protein
MGSLLVSLGGACEALGDDAGTEHFFSLASRHGVRHTAG